MTDRRTDRHCMPATAALIHSIARQKQEALLLQRGRMMLRVCTASIQNVERSLLLLVVSASHILLRTIKFFSVLFSSTEASGVISSSQFLFWDPLHMS